eukprot:1194789-Amorphochlora_amoeboformis.AAC.2
MARLDSVVRRFEEISAIAERIAGIDVPSPLNVPKIPKVRIATLEELNLFDGAPDAMSALEIRWRDIGTSLESLDAEKHFQYVVRAEMLTPCFYSSRSSP